MAINDALAAIAQKLGLADTELSTLEKQSATVAQQIRDNKDRLSNLKLKVANLDEQLSRKKKEYEAAGAGMKMIIKEEMKILFASQDRLFKEEIAIIADRIQKDTLLYDRIQNMIFYVKNPSRTDLIADIAADLEIQYDAMAEEDQEIDTLANAGYTRQQSVENSAADAQFDAYMSGSSKLSSAVDAAQEDDDFLKRLSDVN
ncbi:MAG: hypothetical protein E7058_04665 [Lentisphaerae bacterium]|nr:hypothetical protein [Lentisphaerota bacterium]